MPDHWIAVALRRTPGTDAGTLQHGEQQTPVRGIRRAEDGAMCFDVLEDAAWLDLLARMYGVVRG